MSPTLGLTGDVMLGRNDRSALFELDVSRAGEFERVRLRPVEIRDCRLTQADADAAEWIRETGRERSRPFDTEATFERGDAGGLTLAL